MRSVRSPLLRCLELFVPAAIFSGAFGYAGAGSPGHSIRVPVNFNFPGGAPGQAMTVQVICWSPVPMPGGLTCGPTDTTDVVGSAGMWLPL